MRKKYEKMWVGYNHKDQNDAEISEYGIKYHTASTMSKLYTETNLASYNYSHCTIYVYIF